MPSKIPIPTEFKGDYKAGLFQTNRDSVSGRIQQSSKEPGQGKQRPNVEKNYRLVHPVASLDGRQRLWHTKLRYYKHFFRASQKYLKRETP